MSLVATLPIPVPTIDPEHDDYFFDYSCPEEKVDERIVKLVISYLSRPRDTKK
jgi:hypothetical protein